MILTIDSTSPIYIKLELTSKTQDFEHIFESERDFSEKLIPEIQKFLKKHRLTLKNVSEIKVLEGLNGFSRARTAVATANALAFGLNIKINGLKTGVRAVYKSEPNITMTK